MLELKVTNLNCYQLCVGLDKCPAFCFDDQCSGAKLTLKQKTMKKQINEH